LKFKYFILLGGRPDGRWALPNARMKNFKFYNHTTLYETGPILTFDGYNKLTPPVLEASFTATRLSDWDNSNQSKTEQSGVGDWPDSTTGMTHWWTLHNNDKCYSNSFYNNTRDTAQLFTTVNSGDWNHTAHTADLGGAGWASTYWKNGYKFSTGSKGLSSMKLSQPPSNHETGDVIIKYWDGTTMKTVTNQSPTTFSAKTHNLEEEFTFDVVSSQYWMIECKAHSNTTGASKVALHAWQLLSGRDPVTTVITKGSDSYDIGTASSIYIDATGTYDAQAKNSNTFIIKTSNVVSGSITRSQIWNANESQILYSSDAAANDYLGSSIDISGDYLVVGARGDDSNKGAAYIYMRNGTNWTQQQKITASDGSGDVSGYVGDKLGESVSISGDYVIAGARFDNQYKGAAYIYVRSGTTWSQQQKLTASPTRANDRFGSSVSISGDYAIVGNIETGNTNDSGSAYIYVRSGMTWSQQQKITPSDGSGSDQFGAVVAISGDYAVIAAPGEDTGGIGAGAAYIFKRSGTMWSQQAKIQSSDIAAYDGFGNSVAISGDYAFIGCRYDDDDGNGSGSVYIFKKDTGAETWTQHSKLKASDASTNAEFGTSVSVSGDYLISGAARENSYTGSAYIFQRSGTAWTEVKKITASDAAASDEFGVSVAIDGTNVIVGARAEDTKGSNAGAAYVYEKVYVGPTLTYDNSNKLSLTGVTTPSTNLTVGTNTYDIGSVKDVYIKDQGTYKFHTNDGNQALIMNKTVSSDPSSSGGAGPDIPLAFHHGTFTDSDDPHSDGSITAAATAGHVYSDTATGTYSWGTLTSCVRTAMTDNNHSDEDFAYRNDNGNTPTAGFTTYKWTPSSAITNGRTLVVAGGGGGGSDMGGGGGAGGLLASTTTNIAHTEQTIQVGDGGARGYAPASVTRINIEVVMVPIVPYRVRV